MAPKLAPKSAAAPATPARRYVIVNPAGALHDVTRDHAAELLRTLGFRLATATEIAQLDQQSGEQRFDRPIAEPWSPDPDAQLADPDQVTP